MKVFLSWSGGASRALAQTLRDWLPLVLYYVEPWMSEVDIDAGERWSASIAKELEATNFGIICLTRQNLASPWILFEAGALAKSLQSSTVIPLLFDLEFQDISGPLAQFQAKKLERDDVLEVVLAINKSAEDPADPARTEQLFTALWPQLESSIGEIPVNEEPARRSRPQEEVLEELVASVRALDARLTGSGDTSIQRRRAVRRKLAAEMSIADSVLMGRGDPLSILMLGSAFRDEAPWLYELGVVAFEAAFEERETARQLVSRFLRSVERLMRGRRRLDADPRFLAYLVSEAGHTIGVDLRKPNPEPQSSQDDGAPAPEESIDDTEEE